MKRLLSSWVFLVLILAACSAQSDPTPTTGILAGSPTPERQPDPTKPSTLVPPSPTVTQEPIAPASLTPPPPTATLEPTQEPAAEESPDPFSGSKLPKVEGALFSGSGQCQICHANLLDEAGSDVSIDAFWRSTMMANAARDPYWLASVNAEILELPELQPVIENTCSRCHMPMGQFTKSAVGGGSQIFDDGLLSLENDLHSLAMDGVSCTLCHQIEDEELGEEESFSGGFGVDTLLPAGDRINYGPFDVSAEDMDTMQSASGFVPVKSPHIKQSELCATCHTLYTPIIDFDGQVIGQFPEQTAYLEWLNSDFAETTPCQDCHMPVADGAVAISGLSDTIREPFHKHAFVGGNAYVLKMFRAFGPEQNVTASSDHFEATISRTLAQLEEQTAELTILESSIDNGQLLIEIAISSQAGHKFPSGFPSRRAWLHLVVQDGSGAIVFESGSVNSDGSITANDNDESPLAFEPHYETIFSPDQVQIYEALPVDGNGELTTVLLHGAGYAKDNRLLPPGFDKDLVSSDIAVKGVAVDDDNFGNAGAGGDLVRYSVDITEAGGPFTITAELLYQSIGYRWAQNLAHHQAPAVNTFLEYYDSVPNLPVVVASDTADIEPR